MNTMADMEGLCHGEHYACEHAEQWRGCTHCQCSHHVTGFCPCGACLYRCIDEGTFEQTEYFDVVTCVKCGKRQVWD